LKYKDTLKEDLEVPIRFENAKNHATFPLCENSFLPSHNLRRKTSRNPIPLETMKFAILASLLASAAAFAPAKQASTSTSLKAFEDELGAQPPLGFFDPFGQLSGEDEARFERLRYVEIKHGRICMLAFLGQITTRAGIHLPGSINYAGDSFDSFPNGVAALFGPNSIPTAGLVQIIGFIGILECAFMKSVPGTGNEFVGDFRNGYIDFGWDDFDEETVSDLTIGFMLMGSLDAM
jgi:hypothetical protein